MFKLTKKNYKILKSSETSHSSLNTLYYTQWAKTFRGHTQNVPQKVPADILRTFLCDANRHSTANVLRMSKYRLSRTFDEGAWKVRESSSQDIRNPATKILRMSKNRLPRTFDKGASKVR